VKEARTRKRVKAVDKGRKELADVEKRQIKAAMMERPNRQQ
jgi:hypothetical protein